MEKQSVKTKAVTVNMDEELYQELERIAQNREHSLSHVGRRFIEDAIKDKKERIDFQSKLINKGE